MKTKNNENKDITNNLPDDILYDIVSFLDIQSLLKASLISKRWQFIRTQDSLWTSSPNLIFSFKQFPYFNYNGKKPSSHSTSTSLTPSQKHPLKSPEFIALEHRFLFSRNATSPIHTFSFSCKTKCSTDRLSKYVSAALERGVQEIHLSIPNKSLGKCCDIWKSDTPRVLKIQGHHKFLEIFPTDPPNAIGPWMKPDFQGKIRLPNLQSLHLVKVSLSAELDLLRNCLQLKTLVLKSCCLNCECLRVSSLSLQSLVLEDLKENYSGFCDIAVSAPSLKFFRFVDCVQVNYFMEESTAPAKGEFDTTIPGGYAQRFYIPEDTNEFYARRMINCLRSFKHVQAVTFGAWFLQVLNEAREATEQLPVSLCNLTSLKIKFGLYRNCVPAITCLLQNSPNMETVVFETLMHHDSSEQSRIFWHEDFYSTIQEAGWEAELLQLSYKLDQLKRVEIKRFLGCEDEFRLLKFLLKTASALETIILDVSEECWRDDENIQERISEVIRKFPRVSPSVSVSFSISPV